MMEHHPLSITNKPFVLKFGGTSVTGLEALENLANTVERYHGEGVLVVVSALAGVTNLLEELVCATQKGDTRTQHKIQQGLRLHHQEHTQALMLEPGVRGDIHAHMESLFGELREVVTHSALGPALRDRVLAFGERLSSLLVTAFLRQRLSRVLRLSAYNFVRTNAAFGNASPEDESSEEGVIRYLYPFLRSGYTVVTQGFIGRASSGAPTILGRGGSDYSATLLARYLVAREVWIFSDVTGVLGADPRIVSHAHCLWHLTRNQADLLARLGARILHPRTIQALGNQPLPLFVANSAYHKQHTRIDQGGINPPPVFAVAGRSMAFRYLKYSPASTLKAIPLDVDFSHLVLEQDARFEAPQNAETHHGQDLALLGILDPTQGDDRFRDRLAHVLRSANLPVFFTGSSQELQACFLVIPLRELERATLLVYETGRYIRPQGSAQKAADQLSAM